nr:hypothetical protein [Actinomyces sp.]
MAGTFASSQYFWSAAELSASSMKAVLGLDCSPEGANGWCDAQGISKEDCFAKQISLGGFSEVTTRLR